MFANFDLTDANYDAAWDLLGRRYDNKRILINYYISRLLSIPSAKKETASELKFVVDNFKEVVYSLKNLGELGWNALYVHLLVSRLPLETVALWEHTLGVCKDIPPFEQLEKFLESRIQTLMSLESMREPKDLISKSSGSTGSDVRRCSICAGDHLLYKCNEFIKMGVDERNEFVLLNKLCSICLNTHSAEGCKYKWKCRVCSGGHNSLLHRPGVLTATNASMENVVVLATAIVTLHSSCGVAFNFRALIDTGSMGSFVTEQLMTTLKWPRSIDTTTIIGVGGNTTKTKGTTNFMLYSVFDKKLGIPVQAKIMKKIANCLPQLQPQELPKFDHRQWADPYFHLGGKIDLLLGADCIPQLMLEGSFRVSSLWVQKTHLRYIGTYVGYHLSRK